MPTDSLSKNNVSVSSENCFSRFKSSLTIYNELPERRRHRSSPPGWGKTELAVGGMYTCVCVCVGRKQTQSRGHVGVADYESYRLLSLSLSLLRVRAQTMVGRCSMPTNLRFMKSNSYHCNVKIGFRRAKRYLLPTHSSHTYEHSHTHTHTHTQPRTHVRAHTHAIAYIVI